MTKREWDLTLKWHEWGERLALPLPAALQQEVDRTGGVVDETAMQWDGGSEGC